MMPAQRYLDSYPQHGNQMPLPQQCQPIPHSYGPWPYTNGFGYPVPCNACGSYANMPGHYGFRPAFPPISPPVYQCCGHHLPFGEYYPPQYVPPSHYSTDKPRYEYDKGASGDYSNHCFECPGRTHNQRRDNSVKVEELEPDAQKKGGDSLIPFQWRNYPYPVVWVPSEYMYDKDHRELAARDQTRERKERNSQDMRSQSYPVLWIPPEYIGSEEKRVPKAPESVKEKESSGNMTNYPYPIVWIPPEHMKNGKPEEPLTHKPLEGEKNSQYMGPFNSFTASDSGSKVWTDLFPRDKKDLMQGDDGQKAQDKEKEEKMQQFPFPIIWLPSYNERDERQKVDPQGMKSSSEPTGDRSSITKPSLKALNGDDCATQSQSGYENSGGHVKVEGKGARCIPVKQIEEPGAEKQSPEGTVGKGKNGSDKDVVQITGGESPGTDTKRKSPSSPRTSKLPPVCLRVDPLPKKKNGKASSRSPSPPGAQGRSHEPSKDKIKASTLCELQASNQDSKTQNVDLSSISDLEEGKKEGNVVELKESITDGNGEADMRPQMQIPLDLPSEALKSPETGKSGKNGGDGLRIVKDTTTEELKGIKDEIETARRVGDEPKAPRRMLSDEEAARLIQSAFRGFEVRKWEPLQKLKQLAGVREQVAGLRTRIQSMKSSSDLQDDKQRVLIGEMIMTLLLKLDAIQGVHPDVRDVRKSIARELVSLQQELDSVPGKKSEGVFKEDPTKHPLYDTGNNIVENMEAMGGPSDSRFEVLTDAMCDHPRDSPKPSLDL